MLRVWPRKSYVYIYNSTMYLHKYANLLESNLFDYTYTIQPQKAAIFVLFKVIDLFVRNESLRITLLHIITRKPTL